MDIFNLSQQNFLKHDIKLLFISGLSGAYTNADEYSTSGWVGDHQYSFANWATDQV